MKWVNGILAMLFWWLIEKLFLPHFTTLFVVSQLASIEIPDEIQVNVEHYNIITLSCHEQVCLIGLHTFQEILLPSSGPMMGEV